MMHELRAVLPQFRFVRRTRSLDIDASAAAFFGRDGGNFGKIRFILGQLTVTDSD
jgi:hypothetical protein